MDILHQIKMVKLTAAIKEIILFKLSEKYQTAFFISINFFFDTIKKSIEHYTIILYNTK